MFGKKCRGVLRLGLGLGKKCRGETAAYAVEVRQGGKGGTPQPPSIADAKLNECLNTSTHNRVSHGATEPAKQMILSKSK